MDRTAATGQAPAASGQPAVALRGELWQRHVRLQEMDQADPEYDREVAELLGLTADLLHAEEAAAEERRAARRRTGRILYYCAAALVVVAIVVVALLAPAVAGWAGRWIYASALVVAVVLATVVFRRRVSPAPRSPSGRPAAEPETQLDAEPAVEVSPEVEADTAPDVEPGSGDGDHQSADGSEPDRDEARHG